MKVKAVLWTIVLSVVVLGLKIFDKNPPRDHIGHAVACSDKFPFSNKQAEILEYGLQNVRGLTYDRDGKRLLLSEGDRSLLLAGWNAHGGSKTGVFEMHYPDKPYMCLKERCGDADQRGLVVLEGELYTAEHGRGRIAVRRLPSATPGMADVAAWLLPSSPLVGEPQGLTGPSGIAAIDRTLFITDDRPWPGPPTGSSSYDTADYAAWMGKGTARPFGGLYVCDAGSCAPKLIAGSLRRPSGIAAAGVNGPIFVTEADTHEVRWPIFVKSEAGWSQTGSLGSIPISEGTLPTFLGVALFDPCEGSCKKDSPDDESRKMVFAAGPGGLYVFDTRGTILGRVMFDEPVSGIAVTGKEVYAKSEDPEPTRYRVYLVVGHMLCSLTFNDPSANGLNKLSNPPGAGPPTGPLKPEGVRPRPDQPSPVASSSQTDHPLCPGCPKRKPPQSSKVRLPEGGQSTGHCERLTNDDHKAGLNAKSKGDHCQEKRAGTSGQNGGSSGKIHPKCSCTRRSGSHAGGPPPTEGCKPARPTAKPAEQCCDCAPQPPRRQHQ